MCITSRSAVLHCGEETFWGSCATVSIIQCSFSKILSCYSLCNGLKVHTEPIRVFIYDSTSHHWVELCTVMEVKGKRPTASMTEIEGIATEVSEHYLSELAGMGIPLNLATTISYFVLNRQYFCVYIRSVSYINLLLLIPQSSVL